MPEAASPFHEEPVFVEEGVWVCAGSGRHYHTSYEASKVCGWCRKEQEGKHETTRD